VAQHLAQVEPVEALHDEVDVAVGCRARVGDVDDVGMADLGRRDTPVFAVTSIEALWRRMGQKRYPEATEIFITADAGGSNGYRA
jgi:hypothetical protein